MFILRFGLCVAICCKLTRATAEPSPAVHCTSTSSLCNFNLFGQVRFRCLTCIYGCVYFLSTRSYSRSKNQNPFHRYESSSLVIPFCFWNSELHWRLWIYAASHTLFHTCFIPASYQTYTDNIMPLSDTMFNTLMLGLIYTDKQTRLIAFLADNFIGMHRAVL